MSEQKDLINKDELIKSLMDLDFSVEEINAIVEKAEKDGKLSPADDEVVTDAEGYEEKDEVKKAYDKIKSMKDELDKSMADFLDKYGKVPGFATPTGTPTEKAIEVEIGKSEKVEIEKSEVTDIEKAFGDKFQSIEKALEDQFESQRKLNEEMLKSLTGINATVQAIAETPNPYKGLFGNYQGSLIEKGGKNEDGQTVYSLQDKNAVTKTFEKAIDKIENEADKQIVNNMISSYTISGLTNEAGLDIVKKALNVDFEK